MAKYRVTESLASCLVTEVEANNEDEAKEAHIQKVAKMFTEQYAGEIAGNATTSDWEVEEIKKGQ